MMRMGAGYEESGGRRAWCPAPAYGSRVDAKNLARSDRRAAVGDVNRPVRAHEDRSGPRQMVDDGSPRSLRCHLDQPPGQREEDRPGGVLEDVEAAVRSEREVDHRRETTPRDGRRLAGH